MKFYLDLIKLSSRIYSNSTQITQNTLVYCFAHNTSMLDPMITSLARHHIDKIHIIQNSKPASGVETYEEVMKKYNQYGIVTAYIPFNHDIIQTKYEADAVIKYAIQEGYKRIVLVAPIFHILRASMTMISSAIELNADIKISSIINTTSNWNELCSTHQGTTNASLDKTLELDLERIPKYMDKGDIKTCKEIWEYLDKVN